MTRGRPEILFPLFAELTTLDKVGEKTAKLFEKLQITRPRDLLMHPPARLVDRRMRPDLNGVPDGEVATVKVVVSEHRRGRTRAAPHRVIVEDAAQGFALVFFRLPAARVEAMLPLGETRIVSGKVETWNHMRQMVQPDHVLTEAEAGELPEFEPIYPTTEGLGQRTISAAALSTLSRAPDLAEWIEPGLVSAKLWPGWRNAMEALHRPVSDDALRPRSPARERIAYDELLAHQMALALARETQRKGKGRPTVGTGRLVGRALASLPFRPRSA